jgi:hypothetical protein
MGTSQSSNGPGPRVPLVPPWVPPAPPPEPDENNPTPPQIPGTGNPAPAPSAGASKPVQLSAPGRFGSARTSFGSFTKSGDTAALRRGVSDYVSKGYGGRSSAAKRFEGTARTAGALHGALSGLATGQAGEFTGSLNKPLLQGRSAREIIDAVIGAVRPVDGTQDAEASREAINDSLSDLLERFPDADLLALTVEQREIVVETYTAQDIFQRLVLDVGKYIQDAAPTASEALSRLAQIRDYIREVVAAEFKRLRDSGSALASGHIATVARSALSAALEVFELTRL